MKLKITDVVVHRLSVPLPRPVRTARHDHAHADTVAVEMRTDAGLVGAGYCFAFGARRARALAELVQDLAETYVGRAPAPQARHAEAWRALEFIGRAGRPLMAAAARGTACWGPAAPGAGRAVLRARRGRARHAHRHRRDGLRQRGHEAPPRGARRRRADAGSPANGRPHRVPARGRALPRLAAARVLASLHGDLRAPARGDAERADPRAHGLVGAALHRAGGDRGRLRRAERAARPRLRVVPGGAQAVQGLTLPRLVTARTIFPRRP